jgi:murein DD-endopeptidase MepM/ murein hydrolase activator NlpD
MRRRFLLAVGLAVLGGSVVGGTAAGDGGSLLGVGENGVQINLPNGQNLGNLQVLPQCSNLRDDDGDGLTDLADSDCTGPLDATESGSTPAPPTTTTQPPTTSGGSHGGGGGSSGGGSTTTPATTGGNGVGGGSIGSTGSTGRGSSATENTTESHPTGAVGPDQDNQNPNEIVEQPERRPDGVPTNANPDLTVADFGPAPIGVPNFVIDQFTIPPFLLPIYQACGTQYGIPWEILASINRIESAFGTNLNVSTAGAVGWMQFLPSTWRTWGVDANADGRKDPYNPVDAICAAARYLRAAGGQTDLRQAVFAYNHADWYVDEVILYARQYGRLPDELVGSLTGLTEGDRFPVAAKARYADDISEREALKNSKPGKRSAGNAADVISSSPTRRGIDIYSRDGAPVVAVNDGVIAKIGNSKRLGKYVILKDAYGNRFTYAQLGQVSDVYPVPKPQQLSPSDFKLVTPGSDPNPSEPATAGAQRPENESKANTTKTSGKTGAGKSSSASADKASSQSSSSASTDTEGTSRRLYAYPQRHNNVDRADLTGQLDSLLNKKVPGYETVKSYFSNVLHFNERSMELHPLREGSQVVAGTVLGRIGQTDPDVAPHVNFAIRPAGRGAPKIDPKPILDGWKLLEATAIYRAAGKNPFTGGASTGQVLLMSKEQLEQRVLADPNLEIYQCGRDDIRTGQIDRRILALLEYLVARGYRLTITSLKCGHSLYTTSGFISEHSSGNAVDIAQINGIPVLGNQGPGTLAEALVKDVMQLQGTMAPHQIISLMDFGANTFAMADHDDHVHIGYQPMYGPGSDSVSKQFNQILKPDQWERLIQRLGEIQNPSVPTSPSKFSLPADNGGGGNNKDKRASTAHIGE